MVNGMHIYNSISRGGSAHGANTAQVSFLVSFNEAVQDVDTGDFSLATTGTILGASVASVSGTETSRTVVVKHRRRKRCDWIACEVECNHYGPKWKRNWTWDAGGEVFTIQRSPSFVINDFFSAGHGDVQAAFSDDWLN